MSEMIERVAKALRRNATGREDGWAYEESNAVAAIRAMKEPTDAMVGAGVEGWKINGYASIQFVWPCMIDAALNGEKE